MLKLQVVFLLVGDQSKVEILCDIPQPEQRGVRPSLLYLKAIEDDQFKQVKSKPPQ